MRRASTIIACVLALNFATSELQAQRAVFVGENDVIGKTDRDYTNGFRGSIVFDNFSRDIFAAQAFNFIKPVLITAGAPDGPVRQQFEWVYLGQSIFTPDHTTLAHGPGDRPFGGWLYTGFSLAQETARRQLDTFELLGGVVGPAALGSEVQGLFHRLLGQSPPNIAGYEIHNEPGFLLAWDRRWKVGVDLGDGFGVDVIPSVGFTGGNVFTYGSAGAIFRIGRSLSTTWGPTLVRPAPSGGSFISPNPDAPFWGFDFFTGFEGRAVARNIFLDGNSFETSPRVRREPLVGDAIAGAEIFTQSGYRLAFTGVYRSKEYTTQAKPSLFGSIEGSFRF